MARSALKTSGIERFAAFVAVPDVTEPDPMATQRRPLSKRAEFLRQAAEGMPATPHAAADQAIKMARATGLIPKASAATSLPPTSDPGARAVALARQAGIIR